MITALYNWTLRQAAKPYAERALFAVSFIESSVFPVPPDAMLLPMCLADRNRAFRFAFICTLASILGGLFGYAVGFFLFETIGSAILNFYGGAEQWFTKFQGNFNAWGFWWVMFAGFTPFPYKVITILSGVTHMDLFAFTTASIISRAARFYFVAALLWKFGPPIRAFVEKRLAMLSWLFFALLFGGFLAVSYLFK